VRHGTMQKSSKLRPIEHVLVIRAVRLRSVTIEITFFYGSDPIYAASDRSKDAVSKFAALQASQPILLF
jgi:hypothetical protein